MGHRGLETIHFIRQWARSPRRTASIIPSSFHLAHAMIDGLGTPCPGHTLIELGPGSGVMTRILLNRGFAASDILSIEQNADFVRLLKTNPRFDDAHIVAGDARHTDRILQDSPMAGKPVQGVLSSLPMLNISADVQMDILKAVMAVLSPGGVFVQFTYKPWGTPMKAEVMEALGLKGRKIRSVLKNTPPAYVWLFEKPSYSSSNHNSQE